MKRFRLDCRVIREDWIEPSGDETAERGRFSSGRLESDLTLIIDNGSRVCLIGRGSLEVPLGRRVC